MDFMPLRLNSFSLTCSICALAAIILVGCHGMPKDSHDGFAYRMLSKLILFDMGFSLPSAFFLGGGGHDGPHYNFVVFSLMITLFGKSMKIDMFLSML